MRFDVDIIPPANLDGVTVSGFGVADIVFHTVWRVVPDDFRV